MLTFAILLIVFYCLFIGYLVLSINKTDSKPAAIEETKAFKQFFIAGRNQSWWSVGLSLVAINISLEHIVFMSTDGYRIGLAIAAFEWLAIPAMLIIAKYIFPVFYTRGNYTLGQYLQQRFDIRFRWFFSSFSIIYSLLFTLPYLLWISTDILETLLGIEKIFSCLALLLFTYVYSFQGGLSSIAKIDKINVTIIYTAGLALLACVIYLSLAGNIPEQTLDNRLTIVKSKLHLILEPDNPHYDRLPGIFTLLGGIWIINIWYWGFNQAIIQRALSAKSIAEGQKGIVFAACLKFFIPILFILPGVLSHLYLGSDIEQHGYFTALFFSLPIAAQALMILALFVSVISTIAGICLSTTTLSIIDLYSTISQHNNEHHLLKLGRVINAFILIVALTATFAINKNNIALSYIWDFASFFIPGICAVFTLGLLTKNTYTKHALYIFILATVVSILLYFAFPEVPFLNRIAIAYVFAIATTILLTQLRSKLLFSAPGKHTTTFPAFNLIALGLSLIVAILYVIFW